MPGLFFDISVHTTTGRGRGRRIGGFAMKSMTQPAPRANRPAAAANLLDVGRSHLANRLGRSSQVPWRLWALAAASAVVLALVEPTLLPWLLLPILPALLMRLAGRSLDQRIARQAMWPFSVATVSAVAFQLLGERPSVFEIGVSIAATLLFVGVVERVALGGRKEARLKQHLG